MEKYQVTCLMYIAEERREDRTKSCWRNKTKILPNSTENYKCRDILSSMNPKQIEHEENHTKAYHNPIHENHTEQSLL